MLLTVDLTAYSCEEIESLETETFNGSEEDQPHKHVTESCQGNNENGDNDLLFSHWYIYLWMSLVDFINCE